MTRSYGIRLVALTLGVQTKWLDNLLSHFDLTGVTRSRQGVSREISHPGLVRIEVIRSLNAELGIPLAKAVQISESLRTEDLEESAVYRMPSGFSLGIPVPAIERRLRERLLEAIDAVADIRRGRPKAS